mmetsp:Transcript_19339/g.43111  ORF Transcript_19339/g.43111 Transcript_19339/m.43111 type:complete len:96 (-) Transcript_19339:59-346(-)
MLCISTGIVFTNSLTNSPCVDEFAKFEFAKFKFGKFDDEFWEFCSPPSPTVMATKSAGRYISGKSVERSLVPSSLLSKGRMGRWCSWNWDGGREA